MRRKSCNIDSIEACDAIFLKVNATLQSLGRYIKSDGMNPDPAKGGTGVEETVVEAWRGRFKEAAEAFVLAQSRLDATGILISNAALEDKLSGHKRERGGDSSAAARDCINEIKRQVQVEVEKVNVASNEKYVNLMVKAGLSKAKGGDDDLEVVETEHVEADFLCPYSRMRFKKAMKNQLGKCKHHLDADSLDVMSKQSRSGNILCPIPGCGKHWSKATAVEDKEFMMEMKRFERIQETQRARQHDALDLDEDDGYTQL